MMANALGRFVTTVFRGRRTMGQVFQTMHVQS